MECLYSMKTNQMWVRYLCYTESRGYQQNGIRTNDTFNKVFIMKSNSKWEICGLITSTGQNTLKLVYKRFSKDDITNGLISVLKCLPLEKIAAAAWNVRRMWYSCFSKLKLPTTWTQFEYIAYELNQLNFL